MKIIHVCLVSSQLLPNIIPILIQRPDQVYLIVTPAMQFKAKALDKFLQKRGIKVILQQDAPDHDVTKIMDYALELADTLDNDQWHVVLNVTGGNKLMALGFSNVFTEYGHSVIYTDTVRQQLEHLEKGHAPEPLENVLNIEDYLEAQGFCVRQVASSNATWKVEAKKRKPLSKFLGTHAAKLNDFLSVMNALCHSVLEKDGYDLHLRHPYAQFRQQPRGLWQEALIQMEDFGLLKWDRKLQVSFIDVESTRYLSGIWLEEYAWHIANDIGFDDVKMGVEVTWDETIKAHAPRNEFDLVIVHNNQLLLIECKTLSFRQAEEKNQAIVSKLDSLGNNTGGTFGQAMLLSARTLDDATRERCKRMRLLTLEANSLPALKERLQQWKAQGKLL